MAQTLIRTETGETAVLIGGAWSVLPTGDPERRLQLWAAISSAPGYLPIGAQAALIAAEVGGTATVAPRDLKPDSSDDPYRVY